MTFFSRNQRQEGAASSAGPRAGARGTISHGLRVTMSNSTTSTRDIQKSDESHRVTHDTLVSWKTGLHALHDALVANETAWKNLFSSFAGFSTAAAGVYSARDIESRGVLKAIETARSAIETAPTTDPGYTPMQMVEFARQEIAAMLSRIQNAEALHSKRLEATRQYNYYQGKTANMLKQEGKSPKGPSEKDVDRRTRNQKKVMDIAIQLNSITTQLYTELEYIDMERLAVADRSVAAMLMLQKYYFEFKPTDAAYAQGDKIRLGRRVVPRDEVRPWMPNSLQPANVTPQLNNPSMAQGVPAIAPSPPATPSMSPGSSMQQPFPQQQMTNGVPQAYPPGQVPIPQPIMHHQASAPPTQPDMHSQPSLQGSASQPADFYHAQNIPQPPIQAPQPPPQYAPQAAPPQPVPPTAMGQ